MKIKVHQATFATLDIIVGMAAKQRAFQQIIIKMLAVDQADLNTAISELNRLSDMETNLIRAKLLQYAEVDIDDFLNGEVDI